MNEKIEPDELEKLVSEYLENNFNEPFYKSKRFWIFVIGFILAPILAKYGYNIPPDSYPFWASFLSALVMFIISAIKPQKKLKLKF